MPKFKNSNATFWVIFKQCDFGRICTFKFEATWGWISGGGAAVVRKYRWTMSAPWASLMTKMMPIENRRLLKMDIFSIEGLSTEWWYGLDGLDHLGLIRVVITIRGWHQPAFIVVAQLEKDHGAHCLKITQNVAFEWLNFGIFHQFLSS